MRILVVEDDPSLHKVTTRRLKENGYAVDDCFDGVEALDYMSVNEYDCILLDWMLPKKDGIAVLKEFREAGHDTPVIMLTAKDSVADRVEGLDHGADDYLTKPFAFDELMARIRALLRRNQSEKTADLKLGDLTMHVASHSVTRGDCTIELTAKEYALLEYFLHNVGTVVTRTQIADHVWNYDFDYDSNVVDVYVRYLRNKIDKDFAYPLIHTIRGTGYVMRDDHEKE